MLPAPRVSVIIPSYNAASTLEKAVQSVVAQTESDWELIIIDDASSDGSDKLADQLAKTDARIRVLHQPVNRGKSHAMNCATASARGRWVAILDSDDWYAPTRLQRLLDVGESRDVMMVTDNQFLFDNKAGALAGTAFPIHNPDLFITLDDFVIASDAAASFDYGMLKPIFRTDFVRDHAIDYYEAARLGEDYALLLCYFVAGGTAIIVNEPLYYYVQPFGTLSRQWAQEGRKRYNFEHLLQVNAHFIEKLRPQLQPHQLAHLQQREAQIAAMAYFHQVRECIAAQDIWGMVRRLISAPQTFWQLLADRTLQKLRRLMTIKPTGETTEPSCPCHGQQ